MNSYKSRVNFWINFGSIVHFASTAGRDVSVRGRENVGSAHQGAALCWNFAHQHLADAGNAHALEIRVNQPGNRRGDHTSAKASTNRALDELRSENSDSERNNVTDCRAGVWSEFSKHFVLYHFGGYGTSSQRSSADQGFFAYQYCLKVFELTFFVEKYVKKYSSQNPGGPLLQVFGRKRLS